MEAKRKGINELHTDTRILINVLESKLVKEGGEMVSYKELSQAIARNVQNGARGLLTTAMKHVEKQNNIVLVSVRNEGIKRTEDLIGLNDATLHHIGKASNKSLRRTLNALPNTKLDPAQTTALYARMSALGAFAVCSKPASLKTIEGRVAETQKELPVTETLKLFGK
jgi:threonine dehydrogenase-like Zn-dependent dehydrogenase